MDSKILAVAARVLGPCLAAIIALGIVESYYPAETSSLTANQLFFTLENVLGGLLIASLIGVAVGAGWDWWLDTENSKANWRARFDEWVRKAVGCCYGFASPHYPSSR